MPTVFDRDRLQGFLKDFYTVVKIRIAVFDDEFRKICEYPETAPRICSLIRSGETGLEACRKCDEEAFERAKRFNKPHSYICHAGITEAITPIQVNGEIMGYAIFAHLMPSENHEATLDDICERCRRYGLEAEEARAAASELNTYTSEEISSAMRLLEAIALYIQTTEVVKLKSPDLAFHINRYIDEHIGEKITSDTLCSRFYISRTKLYNVSMNAFGMGIGRYIEHRRIETARKLLGNDGMSVAQVADAVGFPDYNYFCKVFKRRTGLTPTSFRKENGIAAPATLP